LSTYSVIEQVDIEGISIHPKISHSSKDKNKFFKEMRNVKVKG
jgi:hypothetical protein